VMLRDLPLPQVKSFDEIVHSYNSDSKKLDLS
jgi:hypothetical protein